MKRPFTVDLHLESKDRKSLHVAMLAVECERIQDAIAAAYERGRIAEVWEKNGWTVCGAVVQEMK